MNKKDAWIRTYTGGKVFFFEPEKSTFEIEDVAHALSLCCRFNGATNIFYSIAQHCCVICDELPEHLKFTGLMHDASEFCLSDIPKPFKAAIDGYEEAERRFEEFLSKKFGFEYPYPTIIKDFDKKMLATEMRDYMNVNDAKLINVNYLYPKKKKIDAWTWERSKREFLNRYYKYRNYE